MFPYFIFVFVCLKYTRLRSSCGTLIGIDTTHLVIRTKFRADIIFNSVVCFNPEMRNKGVEHVLLNISL